MKQQDTMNAKVTIVISAVFNPDGMASAQGYMQRAIPMLIEHGGEIIRRVKAERAIVGARKCDAYLVMDFPSERAVDAAFGSDAYAEIVPLRDAGFKSMDIVVARSM